MNADPRRIPDTQRLEMERQAHEVLRERWKAINKPTAQGYPPFELCTELSEGDAASIIGIDYSTLKRIRKARIVPYTPKGQKGAVYLVWHLVHYHLFGRKAVLLWGGELPDGSEEAAA